MWPSVSCSPWEGVVPGQEEMGNRRRTGRPSQKEGEGEVTAIQLHVSRSLSPPWGQATPYLLCLNGLAVQAALDILGSGQNLISQLHLNPDLSNLQGAASGGGVVRAALETLGWAV